MMLAFLYMMSHVVHEIMMAALGSAIAFHCAIINTIASSKALINSDTTTHPFEMISQLRLIARISANIHCH